MRRPLLRAIRRILRRLDAVLDPSAKSAAAATTTNGREREIEAFVNLIESRDDRARAYLNEHKQRLIRTLSLVPPGNAESRALELGSYLHMAAALDRVLGYGDVRGAYYSASIGRETKCLAIRGQEPFIRELDLYDVELHRFPYADNSFHLVLCCEIIEHLLHDPMHMLIECRRVLAAGGLLVLTTPNTASLSSLSAVLDGRHNPQVFSRYPAQGNPDIPHVREYTPAEITEALRSAGFEIQAMLTERMPGAEHATWVEDLLRANGFDTVLRGEQIYCLARKRAAAAIDRFPEFLYSSG